MNVRDGATMMAVRPSDLDAGMFGRAVLDYARMRPGQRVNRGPAKKECGSYAMAIPLQEPSWPAGNGPRRAAAPAPAAEMAKLAGCLRSDGDGTVTTILQRFRHAAALYIHDAKLPE